MSDHPTPAQSAPEAERPEGTTEPHPDYLKARIEQLRGERDAVGNWAAHVKKENESLLARSRAAEEELERVRGAKDGAYSERDRLVCALSKVFPAFLSRHPDEDLTWENDWRWIVFITLPTGQASWHIHDSERAWFDHLGVIPGNPWDGHSTEEKYRRLAALGAAHPTQGEPKGQGTCPSCSTPLSHAPGIGPYCPNKSCDRVDDVGGGT